MVGRPCFSRNLLPGSGGPAFPSSQAQGPAHGPLSVEGPRPVPPTMSCLSRGLVGRGRGIKQVPWVFHRQEGAATSPLGPRSSGEGSWGPGQELLPVGTPGDLPV